MNINEQWQKVLLNKTEKSCFLNKRHLHFFIKYYNELMKIDFLKVKKDFLNLFKRIEEESYSEENYCDLRTKYSMKNSEVARYLGWSQGKVSRTSRAWGHASQRDKDSMLGALNFLKENPQFKTDVNNKQSCKISVPIKLKDELLKIKNLTLFCKENNLLYKRIYHIRSGSVKTIYKDEVIQLSEILKLN